MRISYWDNWVFVFTVAAITASLRVAYGEVVSDQSAAILIYPYITVDSAQGTDTLVQVSNTSAGPVGVYCVYQRAATGSFDDCGSTTFMMNLTPQQPISWRASQGTSAFPIDGVTHSGSDGSSNQGSSVPVAPGDPFTGSLRCVAVDRNTFPLGRNVLTGHATVEQRRTSPAPWFDAAAYNAIGITAIEGARNTAGNLIIGGASGEYNGCPGTFTMIHFFDRAVEPTSRSRSIMTSLVLLPCSQDLAGATFTLDRLAVGYAVYNEFEQKFETTTFVMPCGNIKPLSQIDTPAPPNSIFDVGVMGTLTGHTQMTGISPVAGTRGLLALAVEVHRDEQDPTRARTAISNVHFRGTSGPGSDFMRLPGMPLPPECVGDCNYDSLVTVDEVLTGVNIALGDFSLAACPQLGRPWNPFDPDGDGRVTVDELITAINNGLNGCPAQ